MSLVAPTNAFVRQLAAAAGLAVEPHHGLMDIVRGNPEAAAALAMAVVLWTAFLSYVVVPRLLAAVNKPFLDPTVFKPARLVAKENVTHNTLRLRFALPTEKTELGLPIGQHITFLAKDGEGKDVFRPYTPTSSHRMKGFVHFLIKVYPGGKMSAVLDGLKVGESMLMKGPRGRFKYSPNMKRSFGMIAGGTGITPMYQVALAVLADEDERTTLSLIAANLSEEDILLRKELDQLASKFPDRFKVYHVVNTAPAGWKGGVGFVSADIIRAQLPAPADDIMILRCGPKPMNDAMKKHLDTIGYTEEQMFEF